MNQNKRLKQRAVGRVILAVQLYAHPALRLFIKHRSRLLPKLGYQSRSNFGLIQQCSSHLILHFVTSVCFTCFWIWNKAFWLSLFCTVLRQNCLVGLRCKTVMKGCFKYLTKPRVLQLIQTLRDELSNFIPKFADWKTTQEAGFLSSHFSADEDPRSPNILADDPSWNSEDLTELQQSVGGSLSLPS